MSDAQPALALDGIVRTFRQGGERIEVLRGVSISLAPGECVALMGPSGAGKSTLLHIAGLLEHADAGEVAIAGRACGGLSDSGRTAMRRSTLGFVYQFHHLMAEFSALENVMIPQFIAGAARSAARARATALLDRFGLAERLSHRPARLSGGEQQRVAIARAMANGPALLLADEPTGNLDQRTADVVLDELLEVVREQNLALLVATHNERLTQRLDRTVLLQDGVLQAR